MSYGQVYVTSQRERENESFDPIQEWRPWSKAFELFVIYELGFGGRVAVADPDKIVTKTHVLGCHDTTTFSGQVTDLDLFYKVALVHQFLVSRDLDEFSKSTFEQMQACKIPATAFNLSHIGTKLVGEKLAKVALLLTLELLDYAHVSIKDLCAVADLLRQGSSREEVLSLMPKPEAKHGC